MDGFAARYANILTFYDQNLTPLRLGYSSSSDKVKVCHLVVVNTGNIHNASSFNDEQYISTCDTTICPPSLETSYWTKCWLFDLNVFVSCMMIGYF